MRITGYRIIHFARTVGRGLFDRLLVTYIILWWVIRICRWGGHPIPLLNNWLTDFLFVPVVAHIALTFTRNFLLRDTGYRYPLIYLLCIAAYAAIVFEYLLPIFSANTVADPLDVVAYFSGAIFYYCIHQQRQMKPVTGSTSKD